MKEPWTYVDYWRLWDEFFNHSRIGLGGRTRKRDWYILYSRQKGDGNDNIVTSWRDDPSPGRGAIDSIGSVVTSFAGSGSAT